MDLFSIPIGINLDYICVLDLAQPEEGTLSIATQQVNY